MMRGEMMNERRSANSEFNENCLHSGPARPEVLCCVAAKFLGQKPSESLTAQAPGRPPVLATLNRALPLL